MTVIWWIIFAVLIGVAVFYAVRIRSNQHFESSLKLKRAAERYEEQQRQAKGYLE